MHLPTSNTESFCVANELRPATIPDVSERVAKVTATVGNHGNGENTVGTSSCLHPSPSDCSFIRDCAKKKKGQSCECHSLGSSYDELRSNDCASMGRSKGGARKSQRAPIIFYPHDPLKKSSGLDVRHTYDQIILLPPSFFLPSATAVCWTIGGQMVRRRGEALTLRARWPLLVLVYELGELRGQ